MQRAGEIIVLNGTSSAGKTSVARALQLILPAPYLYVAFDTFMAMLPPGVQQRADNEELLHRTVWGMHRAIRVLAEGGSNVIVDHVLRCPIHPDSRDWIQDLMAVLPAERTVLIAVRCSLEELDRRERERHPPGSGFIGLARRQYEQIHRGNSYNLEVDTTNRTAEESARLLADALAAHRPWTCRT